MKKILSLCLLCVILCGRVTAATDLVTLGSTTFTILGTSDAPFTQQTTTLTLTTASQNTTGVYGDFLTTYDWSAVPQFGISLTLASGTAPAATFSIVLYDAGAVNMLNTYTGSMSSIGGVASTVPLTLSASGTGNLSAVGSLDFVWGTDVSDASSVVVNSIQSIPEPSTYALLAISGVAFGGYVIRRRRRAQ
jgi:PEP-CTERM motif